MLKLKLSQNRRNINTHSYLTKLPQNNFITFLYLHKSLNYESSSMRNNYYILRDNAHCRPHFVIIIIKKKKVERITRSCRTLK